MQWRAPRSTRPNCVPCGSARSRIHMRSSPLQLSSLKRLEPSRTLKPQIGNSPAKQVLRRLSLRWGWSARAWVTMPWQSAWTRRKASPATRSNTLQAQAAARTSSVRLKSRWRRSTSRIPMSLIRPTSGGANIKNTPNTACASPANPHTSNTSPKLPPT